MHKNTLNLFLKELNIKHTNSYSSSLFVFRISKQPKITRNIQA